jgi:hypothetical protein
MLQLAVQPTDEPAPMTVNRCQSLAVPPVVGQMFRQAERAPIPAPFRLSGQAASPGSAAAPVAITSGFSSATAGSAP